MTETCATDLAYIAGLLDADGWLSIHVNNHGKPYQGYFWMIGIVNRDLATLQWVQSICGGYVEPRDRGRRAPHAKNWSPVFDWTIYDSVKAKRFLLSVLPYMRIKKRQTEIFLEFLDTVITDRKLQYRLTPEVKRRRKEMYEEVRSLNRPKPESCIPKGVN